MLYTKNQMRHIAERVVKRQHGRVIPADRLSVKAWVSICDEFPTLVLECYTRDGDYILRPHDEKE